MSKPKYRTYGKVIVTNRPEEDELKVASKIMEMEQELNDKVALDLFSKYGLLVKFHLG